MSEHNSNSALLQQIENRRQEWGDSSLRNKPRNYKTVLLGACGVGKTSLVNRHIRGIFNSGSESTIGASFCTNNIRTSVGNITLSIWDTAGQERYASLIPMYYRDARIALVVFDLTDPDSFDRAKHWIETVEQSRGDPQAHNSRVQIILIGNKMDKPAHLTTQLKNDAELYASGKDIPFVKTSAQTGDGVVDIFATAIISQLKSETDNMDDESSDHLVISIDDSPKSSFFGSCFGVPSVLTLDYWRGPVTPLQVETEDADPDNGGTDPAPDDNSDVDPDDE